MTEDFEIKLRRALRPLPAPEGFTERLLQRLPPAERAPASLPPMPRATAVPTRRFALPAALAASLVAAVLLGQQRAQHRLAQEEAAGLAAKQELLQALRVTSQKLDLAYEAVSNPPRAGDEENPS